MLTPLIMRRLETNAKLLTKLFHLKYRIHGLGVEDTRVFLEWKAKNQPVRFLIISILTQLIILITKLKNLNTFLFLMHQAEPAEQYKLEVFCFRL